MCKRRLLLLGKSGQLGWALQRTLALYGELIMPDRRRCDFSDAKQIRSIVRDSRPDVVVNAAAYTAVDRAENERDLARQINAFAPAILAEEADRLGALMIHYSTDYVFDGDKSGFYVETDSPNPLSVYGATKWEGEQAVQRVAGTHLIFRTSWVYGLVGNNFPKKMLSLAKDRDRLRVVADQIGAPTSVDLLADVTAICVGLWFTDRARLLSRCGLYHVVPTGETSWHGLTCELLSLAHSCGMTLKATPDGVEPVATEDYPTAAGRPKNSRLNVDKLADAFDLSLPPWQRQLHRLVLELEALRI